MNNRKSLLRLLLFVSLSLTSVFLSAQTVSKTFKNEALKTVLKEVESQTGLSVIYNTDEVKENKKITATFKNTPVEEVLATILDEGLMYSLQNKMIVISKKDQQNQTKNEGKKTVKGTVLDANGEPIIGASVVINGDSHGTITDFDGNFTLSDVPGKAVLTITYIGYKTVNLPTAGKTLLKAVLEEDSKMIDEVVVVGYGVQNKRDVSTSISSVKAEQLVDVSASDFRQALAGKMPGVQVTQSSGDPEGNVSIRVRGISTVNAGSDPLYIIDGVPVERGFANLNNNDIESVEVLKDASSAAIYGSRGSNGVIIITTKKESRKNENSI